MKSQLNEFGRVSRAIVALAVAGLMAAACGGGSPPGECASDADCADGTVCEPGLGGEGNVCVAGCHQDSQCGAGDRCELVVCVTTPCPGQCVPRSGCATDDDCGAGEVCEPSGPSCGPSECVPGCHVDAQCASGQCEIVQCVTCPCPGHCL